MTTATKSVPTHVPSKVAGEPPLAFVDIGAHEADKARRKAERDAKKEVLMRCLHPAVAAGLESQKPFYPFDIEATWQGPGESGPGIWGPEKLKVVAQNEADAWAMFCDKIEQWPSRRDSTVTIKRGKQMSAEDALAALGTGGDHELPRYKAGVSRKTKGSK